MGGASKTNPTPFLLQPEAAPTPSCPGQCWQLCCLSSPAGSATAALLGGIRHIVVMLIVTRETFAAGRPEQ